MLPQLSENGHHSTMSAQMPSLGARPYMIIEGTLDECTRKFMSQPASQHHLYEIHTAAQSDLVSAVLAAAHIVELARLRDFL
jgi:hypothetical protein